MFIFNYFPDAENQHSKQHKFNWWFFTQLLSRHSNRRRKIVLWETMVLMISIKKLWTSVFSAVQRCDENSKLLLASQLITIKLCNFDVISCKIRKRLEFPSHCCTTVRRKKIDLLIFNLKLHYWLCPHLPYNFAGSDVGSPFKLNKNPEKNSQPWSQQ